MSSQAEAGLVASQTFVPPLPDVGQRGPAAVALVGHEGDESGQWTPDRVQDVEQESNRGPALDDRQVEAVDGRQDDDVRHDRQRRQNRRPDRNLFDGAHLGGGGLHGAPGDYNQKHRP